MKGGRFNVTVDSIMKISILVAKQTQTQMLGKRRKSNPVNAAPLCKSLLHLYWEYSFPVRPIWTSFPLLAKRKGNSEMECQRETIKMIRDARRVLEEVRLKRLGLFRLARRHKTGIKIINGTEKTGQARPLIQQKKARGHPMK